jgi:hypothetical protein
MSSPQPPTGSGTHLQLDGTILPIQSSCVQSATHSCADSGGNWATYSVICTTDPDIRQIVVTLAPLHEFTIDADGVVWVVGKGAASVAHGGVRNFQASSGADVDVYLAEPLTGKRRHLVGTVRCT